MKKQYSFPAIEIRRFTVTETFTTSDLLVLDPNADGAEFDFETGFPS